MRLKLTSPIILVLVIAGVLFIAGTLMSTEDYMKTLPAYKHYKCLICHTVSQPTSPTQLNGFGLDFQKNGYVWNKALALKDSDGDGFPNGVELSDENGDGLPDVGFERSNPGDRMNTPNSVNPGTWSLLKSLFED
ncbi:MAG TPA: hypothetical protein VII85_09800 [Candidatus Krumholzibacteriaceae bacterium]